MTEHQFLEHSGGIADPFNAKYILCFVKHDYGYFTHLATREKIDEELLKDLEAAGMGWTLRHSIYRSVRIFGGSHW